MHERRRLTYVKTAYFLYTNIACQVSMPSPSHCKVSSLQTQASAGSTQREKEREQRACKPRHGPFERVNAHMVIFMLYVKHMLLMCISRGAQAASQWQQMCIHICSYAIQPSSST